jgi:LytS/YehU family sensor histidine kinase
MDKSKIELNDTSLSMKLMNGKKQSTIPHSNHNGTGIENARKRLDLLYKDKYTLQINDDEEVFVVKLAMELVIKDKTAPVQYKHICYCL